MRLSYAFQLFAAISMLHSPAGAQPDDALRAAETAERAWLEHEIGRFATGRFAVFSGQVEISQQDQQGIVSAGGPALATLSPEAPFTLTIIMPDQRLWLRLTQDPAEPDITRVTRLREPNGNDGVTAECRDCAVSLADLDRGTLFLRLAAEGSLLDIDHSQFRVEVAAQFQRLSPATLRLDQILMLSPDVVAWRMRPEGKFAMQRGTAVRTVRSLLRQPAPPPDGDRMRFSCTQDIPYTAQHLVNLRDLSRFEVRDITLGPARRCCVDHTLHEGARMCDGEGDR